MVLVLAVGACSGSATPSASSPETSSGPAPSAIADPPKASPAELGAFQTIRCSDPGPGYEPPEQCDHIGHLEAALAKAIRSCRDSVPASTEEERISFMMVVDFAGRTLEILRGRSSTIPSRATEELFGCVRGVMPPIPWKELQHRHPKYVVYVVATYQPA